MSLDKAIDSGKEHRKQYFGGKQWDWTCRNHGKCDYCANNRQHKFKRQGFSMQEEIEEYDETEE